MKFSCFHDFDAFAESVRDAEFGMLLQNPRHHSWALSQVDLELAHVQFGQEGSGNITEGHSQAGGYLFFLPFTNAGAHAANGVALDHNSIAILEPGVDFCLSAKTDHNWCSVFVPTSAICRQPDQLGAALDPHKTSVLVNRTDGRVANRIRAAVSQIIAWARTCPHFESTPAAASAAQELVRLAVSVQSPLRTVESSHKGRPRISRRQIIHRTKELLEEREFGPGRVSDLAAGADVSERTLRTVFREYYGVGPTRYLQLRQLHQVHRSLRAADPETVAVTDVLVAHGEWEFSRFAGRYRRLFGELPSETLRKPR